MRLLLTRAAEDAARTRVLLEARGHRVVLSPVLRYTGTGASLPNEPPDAVVASSARAFVHAAAPAWDVASLPLYLVGQRTRDAARDAGFSGPTSVTATAVALAAALRPVPPQHLLYLAGVDRKAELEAALAGGPHRLDVVETYAAQAATALRPEAIAVLRDGQIDAVLHFSRRSAAIFRRLAEATGLDLRRPAHLCLSADVAAVFAGFPHLRVAAEPDEVALLALVEAP